MKTSELKKWLEENYTNDITIEELKNLYEDNIKPYGELIMKLKEYFETPIAEREDEKKYRIMIDNTIFKSPPHLTLRLKNNTFYFSAFDTNNEIYRKIFTQTEIDNFPAEIKGAIECGFLRKVEAND